MYTIKAAAFRVTKVLTDNGKEFSDCFRFRATGQWEPTGKHRFDHACQQYGIEQCLAKLRTLQTDGMLERFNGRVTEVVIKVTYFNNSKEPRDTLLHYVRIYNQQSSAGGAWPYRAHSDVEKLVYNYMEVGGHAVLKPLGAILILTGQSR